MQTFEQELNDTEWTEVLLGKGMIAFDLIANPAIFVLFTETDVTPAITREGNRIGSWGDDWDFHASGLVVGEQRIWLKGLGSIRGIR